MRWVSLLLVVALLAACSGPRDTPIPKDISKLESIKPSVEKLKPEEQDLVKGYLLRHTVGAAFSSAFGVKIDPIPDGMTIGKAIDEQKAFVEKQKAEAAAKKAEADKLDAERKALADQMSQILSIRLLSVHLHKASYQNFDVDNFVEMAFEFDNKGSKDITGFKGLATFKDKFGDKISDLRLKVEQKIPAGKSVTIKLSKKYNQFMAEDQHLANMDAETTQLTVSPEVVLFSDGTKFEAPKPQEN